MGLGPTPGTAAASLGKVSLPGTAGNGIAAGKKTTEAFFVASLFLAFGAWVAGTIGFYRWAEDLGVLEAMYRALQLFKLGLIAPATEQAMPTGEAMPVAVQVARFLAPLSASAAVLSATWFLLRDRIGGFRAGRQRDHIVLCGAGEKGLRLVRCFARGEYEHLRDRAIVVVDLETHDSHNLVACREAGAITLTGDARDPSTLRKAGVGDARYLVLTCGNDGTNAEIAIQARDLVDPGRVRALRCRVHLTDPALCRLLRERELEMEVGRNVRLEFFNVYASAARALLRQHPPFEDDAPGPPTTGPRATVRPEVSGSRHVIVVGLDPLGQCVVRALTRSWAGRDRALRLSLYDEGIRGKAESLRLCDPAIEACAELRTRELDRALPSFDRRLLEEDEAGPVAIAYVCLHDDGESLAAALALRRATHSHRFPIVVSMMEDRGLAALLRHARGELQDLRGFPVLDHGCTADVLRGQNEELARAVHEDYVRKARERGCRVGSEPSLVPWSALPESLKRSNRRQADDIFAKLEAIGCTLVPYGAGDPEPFAFEREEIELLARMEHNRWVEERREDGWRLGPVRDVQQKITPYLVDWEELDETTRELDRDAVRNLPRLVALADLALVRGPPATRRGAEEERPLESRAV